MTLDVKCRVDAGMEWLDRLYPNHLRTVIVDLLDVACGGTCPLGQAGQRPYSELVRAHGLSRYDAANLGFAPDQTGHVEPWADIEALNAEWTRRYGGRMDAISQEVDEFESEARSRD